MKQPKPKPFSKYIDHTNLKPDAVEEDILRLCEEAVKYNFATACVASCWVSKASEKLQGSDVRVCTVVGFPFGTSVYPSKTYESKAAIAAGADEIDVVMNYGFLKSGKIDLVETELIDIVRTSRGRIVKVIIETCYLTDEEKLLAAKAVRNSGADYVKTSTGFGPAGATPEDVELIKKAFPELKVKASGGIRTLDYAKKLIEAGASRIGTSSGIKIIQEYEEDKT